MPQIFKFGPYTIFFWSNEGEPLEPIHIHVSYKIATPNSTKIWITKSGKCLLEPFSFAKAGRKATLCCSPVQPRIPKLQKCSLSIKNLEVSPQTPQTF